MENVKHMSVFATMLLIMLFAAPAGAGAQLSWQDNFDYPPGPLYGQGQWVKYASNPNSPIQVVDKTLDFEGYPGGVKGRSVELGPDATAEEVKVTTANLVEPVTLTLGGPNKSKFKLSTATLPATGGSFTVSFNSDEIGVHEAYVKLSSRGAADIYVPVSVNNTTTDGIGSISAETGDIEIFDINGRLVRSRKDVTPAEAAEGLPAGVYVIKRASSAGITVNKVNIR